MSKLPPLATASLGMTCKSFALLAQKSLLARFGKTVGEDAVLDIELLDVVRTKVLDELEKRAVRRLIEANYPVFKSKSLELQNKYELAKSVMFTDEGINFKLVLSGAFPEVSRLLLKHKMGLGDPIDIPIGSICSEIADALINRRPSLHELDLEQIISEQPPNLAAKCFSLSPYTSKVMVDILESGDLSCLEDYTEELDLDLVVLAVCMTNEHNMEQVLKIVSNYPHPDHLNAYLMNWTAYPHLKPVIRLLYERTRIKEGHMERLAISFADLECPMDYYESLYGPALVKSTKDFLQSYNESCRTFSAPPTVPLLKVFEVALFMNCSDSLLEAIMALPDFRHDFPSIVIAIKMGKPVSFLLRLVQTEPIGEYDIYFKPRTSFDFDLEIFRYIAKFRITCHPCVFYLLLLVKDEQPALEYVRVFLHEFVHDKRASKELLTMMTYDRFVDADLIRQELYRFALQRGAEWTWANPFGRTRFAIPTARQEFLDFFDRLGQQVVLNYIPRVVKRNKRGGFFGGILNSSFFYAFCSCYYRPGGPDLLREHIEDPLVFDELKFYADFPDGDLSVLRRIINASPDDLKMALLSLALAPGGPTHIGRVIERLGVRRGGPEFKYLVHLLAIECERQDLGLQR